MNYYSREDVENALDIYGKLVWYSTEFKFGGVSKEHNAIIKQTIHKAKHEFPPDFKNKKFFVYLSQLEKILNSGQAVFDSSTR